MALLRKTYRIFLTVFLLGDLALTLVSAENSWDRQRLKLKQGEEGQATCTVYGLGPFDVVRLVKKNGAESRIITDNDDLKDVFSNSPRYSVIYNRDPPTGDMATITLVFKGARGEDSGDIGCSKLGQVEAEAAWLKVKVQVPVESVNIEQVGADGKRIQTVQGSTVRMREGEERGVVCTTTVDGSTKPADVSIFVDKEDVTELFTKSEPEPNPDNQGPADGMPRDSARQELMFVTSTPDHKWNEGNLTCVATTPGFPSKAYNVMIDIEYAPRIICPKYEVVAKIGDSVEIACTVEANPGPKIEWQSGDDASRANDIEEFDEDGNMRSYQRALNGDSSEVVLAIELLDESHFTNYYLTAENDLDQAKATIKLTKGTDVVSNGAENKNPSYSNENQVDTVSVVPVTEVKGTPKAIKPTKVKLSDRPEAPQESKQPGANAAANVIPSVVLLSGLCLLSAWRSL